MEYQKLYERYLGLEKEYTERKVLEEETRKILGEKIKLLEGTIRNYNENAINAKNLSMNSLELKNRKVLEDFEHDIKSASLFSRIKWFLTMEKSKERRELKRVLNQKLSEEYNKLSEANKVAFEKDLGRETRELEFSKDEEKRISLSLKKVSKELERIILYKGFISSGDKKSVDDSLQRTIDIVNLNKYPSRKELSQIRETIKILENRYSRKELKDDNFNKLYKLKEDLKPGLKKQFVKKEIIATDKLLGDIDNKSLDKQQRVAVVTDEDNNLVVAGAGSGKTLTISAKVKYLIENLKVDPKDILLISFTKKAADEMQERITGRLGLRVNVKTYHSLGLQIINSFRGKGQEILSPGETRDFVGRFINNRVVENKELSQNIFEYFSTYMNEYKDPEDFDSLGEYYTSNKQMSLETLKGKTEKEQQSVNEKADRIFRDKMTFRGERVKSVQELIICNYLFSNSINYIYEDNYKYNTANKEESKI